MQNHPSCRNISAVVLPARVLEISITKEQELNVRLVETKGKEANYVCLSHRWIEGQTITTTTSNIDDRRAGIPWDEFPRTFQEAITVTYFLGFRYIWIDSLSINQDPASGDWFIEASKMAQYYQNSTLTISAAEANDGLFYSFPGPPQVKWEVEPPEHFKQPSYSVFMRKPLSHDVSALHHRGWVFQEHLLSPRVAHFGKELIWECAELTACECGRFPLPTRGGRGALHDAWDIGNVVSTYGRKQGHMMALSSTRPESSFAIIPQPVFLRPDVNSSKSQLEISHWILKQTPIEWFDGNANGFADDPERVPAVLADSQPNDEDDENKHRLVILGTSGVYDEDRVTTETTSALDNVRIEDHDGQETVESDHDLAPSSDDGNDNDPDAEDADEETIRVSRPTPLAHSRWLDIIAHYTRRKLTFRTDVLPALAGLAKQFQLSSICEYYAGLWETTFPIDLLWRTRDPEKHSRPTKWCAPSWSWASTTAAVDYYHLLMAFELDSHTFRYSISHSFIDVLDVDCVPLEGDDATMALRSAKVQLRGTLFQLDLFPTEEKGKEQVTKSYTGTADGAEDLRDVMEQAICLPKLTVPEEDIRYFPLARCMDNKQECTLLASDTGLSFILEKDQTREVRQTLEMWWDCGQDMYTGKSTTYDCLLIARHESTMDTAFFSLVLKRCDEVGVYKRIGLLRHEFPIDVDSTTVVTIV